MIKIFQIFAFILFQVLTVLCQRNWLPESITALEMWSPATWYYPHGIAASEAWTEYLKNAQEATNQLYQQFDQTGAANLYYPNTLTVEDSSAGNGWWVG